MKYIFIILILLNFYGCSLTSSSDDNLKNLSNQNAENLVGKDLLDAQERFKQEINKHTGKIQSIYKEQLQLHDFPDQECIGFQFQMTANGVVKSVKAERAYMTTENIELAIKLVDLFKKIQFPSASSDYSTPYKFCFHK